MEQYFRATRPGSDDAMVSMATIYLTGDAKQNYGGPRGMRTSRLGLARSTLGKISRKSLRLSSCPRTLIASKSRLKESGSIVKEGISYFIGTGTYTKLWVDPWLNGSPLIYQPSRSHPTAVERFPISEHPAHWIVGCSGPPVGLFFWAFGFGS